ncbi:MAG: hypothetical protein JWM95_4858 [Gemmatimonadetes bacterium]|nr:hypothetical protein [Gemmatimonadota bacterium]
MTLSHIRTFAGAILMMTLAACSDSITDVVTPAGDYRATQFTTTTNGAVSDQIALGATVRLILQVGGATSGSLFLPRASTGTADQTISMDGTWTVSSGNIVQLQQNADTFLRNLPLHFENNALTGDQLQGGTRVHIVFTRQ